MSMSDPTPAAAGASGKKKSPLMIIVAVAVLAAGAAGGGAWFFLRNTGPAPVVEKKLSEHGLVKMEPFVVNLADEGNQRFLRASIQLVVEDEAEALEFEEKPVLVMGARSAIVNTLTEQTSEHLASVEGKAELREALKEKVSEALKLEVVDVLFSDFVIQY
jgi:flagellar FliL protein